MSRTIPTPRIHELAEKVLAYEAGEAKHLSPERPPGFRVVEKLRASLVKVAGVMGFRSLQARALTLATDREPALRVVQIMHDGSLGGLDDLGTADQTTKVTVILIAQLLGLFAVLVGEDLILYLVRDVWPEDSAPGGYMEKNRS